MGNKRAIARKRAKGRWRAKARKGAPTAKCPVPTEWFEVSGSVVGVVPLRGLYVWSGASWAWHAHGTDGWNEWHQDVYRSMRARPLPGPPEGSAPLPAPAATVADDRDALGPWADSEELKAWVGAGRTAWVVLKEDPYERLLGDGEFRYLVACVATRDAAMAVPVSGDRHVRRLELRRVEGVVVAEAERESFADRYRVADAVARLLSQTPPRRPDA